LTDTGKIDFLTGYVNDNYIKKKAISDTLALTLLDEAEKRISKATDKKRQYTVYSLLYTAHRDLKNTMRAAAYKRKAAKLNVELGDLQKQELEHKNQIIEQQQGSINKLGSENHKLGSENNKLGSENEEKEKIITETTNQLNMEKLERENKEAQLKAVEQEKEIQQLELNKKKTLNTVYFLIIAFFVIITGATVKMYFNNRKFSRKLSEQNALLANEKKRSDDLLLNILPEELANELKRKGQSKARSHEAVTVMFTDFVDFSRMTELMNPQELVHEIDFCFRSFDEILNKYDIEKIKTVGDAYLCACGIPGADADHAEKTIKAAIEIRNFMKQLREEREAKGMLSFELRIGIHSGPLVAGIVGIKKFAYDIWGDTVNIASRMESSGEAGKINVSESTYDLVKDKFYFISRGKVEAKNKGLINMYFVEEHI
jgi:adenylate cyclase